MMIYLLLCFRYWIRSLINHFLPASAQDKFNIRVPQARFDRHARFKYDVRILWEDVRHQSMIFLPIFENCKCREYCRPFSSSLNSSVLAFSECDENLIVSSQCSHWRLLHQVVICVTWKDIFWKFIMRRIYNEFLPYWERLPDNKI